MFVRVFVLTCARESACTWVCLCDREGEKRGGIGGKQQLIAHSRAQRCFCVAPLDDVAKCWWRSFAAASLHATEVRLRCYTPPSAQPGPLLKSCAALLRIPVSLARLHSLPICAQLRQHSKHIGHQAP